MNYIQKREGYSAIKALAAVNNAIIGDAANLLI